MKHLNGLVSCLEEGYEAAVCFVIQMADIATLSPNDATHPEFGKVLRRAKQAGVQVLALSCQVEPGTVRITEPVSVIL